VTREFAACFGRLPERTERLARRNCGPWKLDTGRRLGAEIRRESD
jgi:hypothetical protein